LCLVLQANAQIKVLSPESLIQELGETKGKIEGSTATFGAPFYGDKVLGRLVYAESKNNGMHCKEEDYVVPSEGGIPQEGEVRLINIIMVRRGKCSFVTKVRVASAKGAHAVIIVDKEDSKLTAKDLQKIIVADDGYGDSVSVPSVLISKDDGAKLIRAAGRSSPVILELKWDIPTDHVVIMDLWMNSASKFSQHFLKEFASKRKALNEVVKFQPHYAVFSMPNTDPRVYNDLCSDYTGEFCAEDPDGGGSLTGRDVLEEDVRQLCIHEHYKVPRPSNLITEGSRNVAEFARQFWDYVEIFGDRCTLDATNEQDRFGLLCSERVMNEVGIDAEVVRHCVLTSKKEKLKKEREDAAWSPRALRINGWRYSGTLDADLVTRAICEGFIRKPPECEQLLRPRDPFVPYQGPPPTPGVSFFTFVIVLFVGVLLTFAGALIYKNNLKQSVRTTLREEVMLEVQAQMGEYRQMGS